MWRSTISFSCARFIMLSLSGARQICGNKVRMSIFIKKWRKFPTCDLDQKASWKLAPHLFHDLEGGALAVTRSRAGKKRANGVNGLAVAADDSANVALAQLHFKDRHVAARNFREHHLVRVLDELADDKLKKLPHVDLKACAKTRWSAIECVVRRDLFIDRITKSSPAREFCLRQNLIH